MKGGRNGETKGGRDRKGERQGLKIKGGRNEWRKEKDRGCGREKREKGRERERHNQMYLCSIATSNRDINLTDRRMYRHTLTLKCKEHVGEGW